MKRGVFILLLLLALPTTARAEDVAGAYAKNVLPVLTAHCTKCHGGEAPEAKLDRAGPRTLAQLREFRSVLIVHRLDGLTLLAAEAKAVGVSLQFTAGNRIGHSPHRSLRECLLDRQKEHRCSDEPCGQAQQTASGDGL